MLSTAPMEDQLSDLNSRSNQAACPCVWGRAPDSSKARSLNVPFQSRIKAEVFEDHAESDAFLPFRIPHAGLTRNHSAIPTDRDSPRNLYLESCSLPVLSPGYQLSRFYPDQIYVESVLPCPP
jgi:hypothetical protein